MELNLITREGVDYITSMTLAGYFNKRHDHVLRDIRQMEPKWFEAFKNNTPNLGSCSTAFLQVPVEGHSIFPLRGWKHKDTLLQQEVHDKLVKESQHRRGRTKGC